MRKRKKILFVLGTRPEAIKLAPVVHEVNRMRHLFVSRLCVTAQHREMLDQVVKLFQLRVHHDLNIMQKGQSLEEVTSRVLLGVRKVIAKEEPDIVIVQGDTTTTFASALAAFYEHVPIAHVEAGLRTWDMMHPYPEEMNRVLTSHLATLHFAPTAQAKKNLLAEGIDKDKITVTGNTGIDALNMVRSRLNGRRDRIAAKFRQIDFRKKMILVTGHRRESFGSGFRNICMALWTIASSEPDVQVVYPVHLNPHVQKPVNNILSGVPNIHLLKPLEYEPFVFLMRSCYLILTDSGGVQEEAPSLGKPVLVMRDRTERPEGVASGTVRLVGTETNRIVREVRSLLHDQRIYRKMVRPHNPYGDGKAGRRIVNSLKRYLHASG